MASEQDEPQPERPRTGSTVADPARPAPGEPVPPPLPGGGGLPRWLLLLLGAAAGTIAVAGLRSISWLVGPVFLALVVVVALAPVQRRLRRAGLPRWLATTIMLVLVWSVLLAFVGLLVLSVAELAAQLPAYRGRAQSLVDELLADLNEARLVQGTVSDLVERIDYGSVVDFASGLLAGLTDTASTLVLLLTAMVFITVESSGFGRRMALIGAERPHLPVAMTLFAQGTRSYLLVSTVFGAIVAVGDYIALAMLGVPAAALWGLLAFITNYVPTIGFVLGLIPPALLGLLAGGWGELVVIVLVYSVLNFVVQTLIQPRFVGDSVGLSMTVTFVALLFWGWVLGALGALLAIPLTLLAKALLVDVDPRGHWLDALLREEPRAPRTNRARRRMHTRRTTLATVRHLHLRRAAHLEARGTAPPAAPPVPVEPPAPAEPAPVVRTPEAS